MMLTLTMPMAIAVSSAVRSSCAADGAKRVITPGSGWPMNTLSMASLVAAGGIRLSDVPMASVVSARAMEPV